jgi:hypothetical protein
MLLLRASLCLRDFIFEALLISVSCLSRICPVQFASDEFARKIMVAACQRFDVGARRACRTG